MSSINRGLHGIFAATAKSNTLRKMVEKFKKSSELDVFRSTRADVYANTVRRLATYGKLAMIKEIIDHQKQFSNITEEIFMSRLISLYGKARMFREAQKLFDEMLDLKCPRTVRSLNTLLSASIDSGRYDQMERIIRELPCKLGITLDVVSYNVAIKGFCKMGALDSGLSVLDEMVNKGVAPNIVTFNTLLFSLYKDGRFVDGERVWDRMLKMNIMPDIRSYNAKLVGLTKEKRTKEAVKFASEMKAKGIELDSFSFNIMIRGFVDVEELDAVKHWYNMLQRHRHKMDNTTVATLVPFIYKRGDLDLALEICELVLRMKCLVDVEVLQLVTDGLVKESKTREAEQLVELAKSNKYDLKMPAIDAS